MLGTIEGGPRMNHRIHVATRHQSALVVVGVLIAPGDARVVLAPVAAAARGRSGARARAVSESDC
jgi:hypothetical protein